MTEVWFYHLQRKPLEAALPELLERSLERGWRVVVQMTSEERMQALDSHLWTFRDDSFLPHGTASERGAADQPVLLTTGADNANAASVRFLIDGAALPEDATGYQRLVLMFDGNDDEASAAAREQWKLAKGAGLDVTYWQQNAAGRWEKKA